MCIQYLKHIPGDKEARGENFEAFVLTLHKLPGLEIFHFEILNTFEDCVPQKMAIFFHGRDFL